jgi:stage V sporulation protein SpoVS
MLLEDEALVWVSNTTGTKDLGQTIYNSIEEGEMPVLRAIGAGAVCQACKGIAVASSLVAVRGRSLATSIGFDTIRGDNGKDITAQTFYLFLR